MKKFLTPLLSIFLFSGVLYSQNTGVKEPCGFDHVHTQMLQEDPEYRKNVENLEEFIYKKVSQRGFSQKSGDIVTIPIVFHIIHIGESHKSNISKEQVESSVEGMNIQYRNINPDGSKYDAGGIDLKIEFCLAKRDPNGDPTEGIVRVDGRSIPSYESQGIVDGTGGNERQVKALSKWPNDEYYNVWVVHSINNENSEGGGTKGYAYFPGAGDDVDGTVVLWNSCGYDPDGSRGFNLFGSGDNGTMVHEIGHAFSLHHTWRPAGSNGSNCPPSPESDCLGEGDQVCDTDPHRSNLGTCKKAGDANDCTGGVYNDAIARNYMNYTNCSPLIFTPGQRDRIKAALAGGRSYFNNPGATPEVCVPVFEYDAAIANLASPTGFYCDETISPVITLKNNGQITLTSVKIEYGVDGVVENTFDWAGSLAQLNVEEVTLPSFSSSVGSHNFFVRIVDNTLNGVNADAYVSNNAQSGPFEIINGIIVHLDVTDAEDADEIEFIDENDQVVYRAKFKDQPDPYLADVCLPSNNCFRVVFKDKLFTHPSAGGTPPSYSVRNDIGYELATGFPSPPFTGGAYNDTSDAFCLPFDPGFITANFTASKTIVTVGEIVQFTDLSKNNANESPTQWEWDFGDFRNAFIQHPTHSYTAAGIYTVWLRADNDIFPDTLVKKHYIRVIEPVTGCDEFNNMLEGETTTYYSNVDELGGTFPGENSLSDEIAEKFFVSSPSVLDYVKFNVSEITSTSTTPKIELSVYDDFAGFPDQKLFSQVYNFSDFVIGENTIAFPTKVEVGGFFYIGYKVITQGDNFIIGVASKRGADDLSNTIIAKNGNDWYNAPDVFGEDFTSSMDMTVNLSYIPKAELNTVANNTCEGLEVVFNGEESKNANEFEWILENAAITNSNDTNITTQFTTSGTNKVTLVVTGGCAKTDSAFHYVDVLALPELEIETVSDVCDAKKGSAKALVTAGSGSFHFSWNVGESKTGKSVSNLGAGMYELVWSDLGCEVFNNKEFFEIENVDQVMEFEITSSNTACGFDNGSAAANPTGGIGNYRYFWESMHDPSYTRTSKGISNLKSGVYKITVSDGNCTPRVQTIEILGSDSVKGEVDQETTVCYGNEVVLNTQTNVDSVLWVTDLGKEYSGKTLAFIPQRSSYLTVVFRDQDDCTLERNTRVNVVDLAEVTAGATVDPANNFADTVYLDLEESNEIFFSSSGSFAEKFEWDFGDGEHSRDKNPTHTYSLNETTEADTFMVRLKGINFRETGSDTLTCEDESSVVVFVKNKEISSGIQQLDNEVKMYPNPTQGLINIQWTNKVKILSIYAMDLSGKVVSEWEKPQGVISLQDKESGIYFIGIKTTKGIIHKKIELIR